MGDGVESMNRRVLIKGGTVLSLGRAVGNLVADGATPA